jgi:hypothetical protein
MAPITTEPRPCGEDNCDNQARLGFRITRPDRGMRGGPIRLTVWPDDREAPAKASLACKQHGIDLIGELLVVLVSTDESFKKEAS